MPASFGRGCPQPAKSKDSRPLRPAGRLQRLVCLVRFSQLCFLVGVSAVTVRLGDELRKEGALWATASFAFARLADGDDGLLPWSSRGLRGGASAMTIGAGPSASDPESDEDQPPSSPLSEDTSQLMAQRLSENRTCTRNKKAQRLHENRTSTRICTHAHA